MAGLYDDAWQRVLAARTGSAPVAGQAAAQAAGGSPVPPPAAAGNPIPGVDVYGQTMARAQQAYDAAVANTRGNLANNLRTLGFNSDGSVNPQNAYGLYQQNRRAGGIEQHDLLGSSTNRGLGQFGGLADQARERANFQSGAGMSGILNQAQSANDQAAYDIQQANFTLQDKLAQAQLSAAETNIESRNFTEAAATAMPTTSPTSASAKTAVAKAIVAASKMTPAEKARLAPMAVPKKKPAVKQPLLHAR